MGQNVLGNADDEGTRLVAERGKAVTNCGEGSDSRVGLTGSQAAKKPPKSGCR